MEIRTETEAPAFLYEALSPLCLSHSDQSTPLDQSPARYESQPYNIFRNEISLSAVNPSSVDSATPDFFSLDVETGSNELEPEAGWVEETEPVTPIASTKKSKRTKKDREAEQQRLESSWFSGNSRFKSPMLQLHKEIVDFCEFLSPTQEEKASRAAAVERVSDVIKYIWPGSKVEVFGSYRTGLYLPTSDIDAVILKSGITNYQMGLQALARALAQRGIAKKIQVIGKARVPIVKFVEKQSAVAFDLSFDAENGPKAAEFIQDAVTRWPPLQPLCLVLKVFLQQRDLNEVYKGGLGSYALLAMLIAFQKYINDGRDSPEQNLGVLLVKFFDLYGRKLNVADVGVSCKEGGSFYSKSSKGFLNKGRPCLISIEDPQALENDIGKNSFNYFQIRSAFAMAFTSLTNPKTILSLGPRRSILGTIIRPDPVLLERRGGKISEFTFSSLLPGADEPLQMNNENRGGLFRNWELNNEEEPLPRWSGINGDVSPTDSSGKKRKALTSSKRGRKKGKKVEEDKDDFREPKKSPSQRQRRRSRQSNRLTSAVHQRRL